MATRFVPPTWQEFDSNGDPLSGGKLSFYSSGTLVAKNTYSNAALTVANANPVVADSAGRFGNIFLEAGTYRVILKDSNDVTIWDRDPVEGAGGGEGTVDEKTAAYTVAVDDDTKTIAVDATAGAVTITLLAAATATDGFQITIKKTDSSANAVTVDGNGAELIDGAATFVLPLQYAGVTLRCDGTGWHVLAAVEDNTYTKIQKWAKGADLASPAGGALTLGTDGNYFDITGTNAITSIVTAGAGTVVKLHFDAALTLTHHATDLILPGAANITTAAGDEAEFIEYATGDWRCTNYVRAAAPPLAYASQAEQETGTAVDRAVTPGRQHFHSSAVKLWGYVDRSAGTPTLSSPDYNITSVTDDGAGQTIVTIDTDFSTAVYAPGVSCTADGGATFVAPHCHTLAAGSFKVTVNTSASAVDTASFAVWAFGDHA